MSGDDVRLQRFEALDVLWLEIADAAVDRNTDTALAAALHREVEVEQHVGLAAAIADHAQEPEPVDETVAVRPPCRGEGQLVGKDRMIAEAARVTQIGR